MRGNAWLRRAEEFDALLTGRAGDAARDAELLDVVAALRAVPAPEARPDFVASLRTQLVAAAEREPSRAEAELAVRLTPRQRRGSRERRLAAVVGGFAVVSATGSMAMASQGAMPGDVLYPVKRAIENAQTNLQPNNASKSVALIAHARSRLAEVEELTARDADADVVAATLEEFTEQTQQAAEFALDDYAATADADTIADLRDFTADSMKVLTGLGPVVPAEARPILITATQTIRQVDAAAWEACPSCAAGSIAEMPDFATQSLSAVLRGDVPESASVLAPATQPKKGRKAPKAADVPSGEQPPVTVTVPESPVVPVPSETQKPLDNTAKTGGTVGEKVDKLIRDDLGIDGESGLGPTKPKPADGETTSTNTSLTGTLIDVLTGILGGLLR